MNLPLFLSKRLYSAQGDQKKVSRPAIRIATIGVAIGLVVMIITVSVVLGFKDTVRSKVIGFGSHIQVVNKESLIAPTPQPISIDSAYLQKLKGVPGVRHAERYVMAQGILKTDQDFLGVMFKGIGPEYDISFIKENLVAGELPQFIDAQTQDRPLVISKTMANKLRLKVGDKIMAYFIVYDDDEEEPRPEKRPFTVKAIYQSHMKRFDDVICLTNIHVTRQLNGWPKDMCSGAELLVDNFDKLDEVNSRVIQQVKASPDREGNEYTATTITETYRQVFDWLELLDINVWIILALMIAVSSFTIISGLLIIILERTQMIGILKALGARNSLIRKTFLWFSAYIIGWGLFWGNLIGIGIVVFQQTTGFIKLDADTYYVSEAPMELNLLFVLLINIATLLISLFVLIGPSYLVSRIHPARSMRYE